jgi:MYXO-CTERM domain-containing protein
MLSTRLCFFCLVFVILGPSLAVGDFVGPYEMQNWSSSGITDGTTSISPGSGPTDTADFGYMVNLGSPGPGVSPRTTDFTVIAAATGIVTFDYTYSGFHSFFATQAQFFTIGDTIDLIEDFAPFGNFSVSGSATINVTEGSPFGFRVGGRNFDSNSQLNGTLTITNFFAPGGAIPEPSSTGLAAMVLAGLLAGRRRRCRC